MTLLALILLAGTAPVSTSSAQQAVRGERLDPKLIGPVVVETMDEVLKREREGPPPAELRFVPRPQVPPGYAVDKPRPVGQPQPGGSGSLPLLGGGGTTPAIGQNFPGPVPSDPGAGWIPPDEVGAAGPTHFVASVNKHLSIYVKATGVRVLSTSLGSFFGVAVGDPRVAFDPTSQRFIVLGSDFSSRIFIAVSASSDPTGAWLKFGMNVSAGTDAGHWPDYPTLGVDANGVYAAAYMVGGADTMSIFAVDMAPMVGSPQAVGTVTAFRGLLWEGAIHPCVTYGNPGGEYLVSRASGSTLRLYRVNPPLAAPTLSDLGTFAVQSSSSPPDAPNMGSTSLIETLDGRLMNAVYRNGSVWTTHGVNVNNRAGCQWYQLGTSPPNQTQWGRIDDPVTHYFFPSIAVNAANEAVLSFGGSSASSFAGGYVTGRKATDPSGQTGPPQILKAGEAGYNVGNPSRWGDYSLTCVDPTDDTTFWAIQEYVRASGSWGTWIGEVRYTCPTPTSFCIAAPNSANPLGATMSSSGTTSVSANNFTLLTFSAPPSANGLYFYGQLQIAPTTFGNGWRCIGNPLFRLPVTQANAFGDVSWNVDLNSLPPGGQIGAGQSWSFQLWYRDPAAGGANFNASDGIFTQWCP